MAFQPVNNTAQVEMVFLQDGVTMENVINVNFPGGYTLLDLQDLADAVDDWVHTEYKPLISTGVDYVRTTVTGLENQNDFQVTVNTNAGAGTGGSVPLPANVSKAITFKSGLTGRSARGRMYLVGLSTSSVLLGSSEMVTSFIDDVFAALEALKTIIEALSAIWVIVSRYTNGALRPSGAVYGITEFSVSNYTTDSMRGRLIT